MVRRSFNLFLCYLFLLGAFSWSTKALTELQRNSVALKIYDPPLPARRGRSLLSGKELDTELVAALDGTIYLLGGTGKLIWSLSTGPQIYSSYQALISDKAGVSGIGSYYIDCGDDWKLYAHYNNRTMNLTKNYEEYLSSTPQIAEDGGIVLGSKKTTAFLVDAKTGKIMHAYGVSDSSMAMQDVFKELPYNNTVKEQNASESDRKTDELPLHITRKDYRFTSYMPNSDIVLWSITVAEIEAAFLCQDIEMSLVDSPLIMEPEPGLLYKMPLSCQSKARVQVDRFLNHNMQETSLPMPKGLPETPQRDMMLPASASRDFPSQAHVEKVIALPPLSHTSDKILDVHENKDPKALPLQAVDENYSTNLMQGRKVTPNSFMALHRHFGRSQLLLVFIALVVFGVYLYNLVSRANTKLDVQSQGSSHSNAHSKRKRSQKSGKGGSNSGQRDEEENEVKHPRNASDSSIWLNFNLPNSPSTDGRTIGKLFVSNKEIAKGSNGTIVLEGIYEGRSVAVKRLVRAYHDIAFKEIKNLILSDRHPNIVRWYGVEQDQDFVYLALERCACSLNDLIFMQLKSSNNPIVGEKSSAEVAAECTIPLDSMQRLMHGFELWNSDGYPSPSLLKIMRDVISGIAHLHELGIIHRDLKPQNVLIIREGSLRAKLSDMGISKRLVGDLSSLTSHATGCGSSGWQAPEQLLHGRQTRAVDLFSLGCVLFYCISGGRHPFGNRLERDVNIAKGKVDLFPVEHIPEAVDLIQQLLDPVAELRPTALEVHNHPLFWTAEMRLSFLRDASDRVELENRETDSDILKALERIALGAKWNEKMEPSFLNNIGHYRRYKFDSVRDLLRVMRNKLNHYRELPIEIQDLIGSVPRGFDRYFASRFPKLLIEVYKVMLSRCKTEEWFSKYFGCDGE